MTIRLEESKAIAGLTQDEPTNYDDTAALQQGLNSKGDGPKLIFSSPAKYSWIILIILTIGPLSVLASTYLVHRDSDDPKTKGAAYFSLAISLIIVGILYLVTLPRSFSVYSDASVRVVTLSGIQWTFDEVVRAYKGTLTPCDPRFKFATDLGYNRVVVVRKNRQWGLIVSPHDVDGFIDAVWRVSSGTTADTVV